MTVRAEDSAAQKQALEVLRRIQTPRSSTPAPRAPDAPATKPVEMKKVAPMAVSAPVANPVYAPASDSVAQQQALEVLRARQSGKAAPAVVSTPKPTAKPPAKPADMRPPAVVAVTAPMASPAYASPSDSAAQKQALEVLRARQSGKAAPAMVSTPKPRAQPPAKPADVRRPAAVAVSAPVAKPASIAPSPSAAQLQAMEVLRSKQSGTAKSPTQVSKIAATPIPAMAPTTKEGKLAELTRRYLNDEVTPREYHTQRAKILAD